MATLEVNFDLYPKQMAAFRSEATELLYGGAKGGGKSYLMRVCAIRWCIEIAGLQVYLFRRTSPELQKSHMAPAKFPAMVQPLVAAGLAAIVREQIRFWNKSVIHLCHCQYANDLKKYAGVEIHVLMIDQLEEFEEPMYRALRAEVRMTGIELPASAEGRFPRILVSDNPGGVGDSWIMQTWNLNAGEQSREPGPVWTGSAGMTRQFIPALLEDNPALVREDPTYDLRLSDLGNPELVAALRRGVRGQVTGSFFGDVWNRPDYQVLPPFDVPSSWERFGSFDWGSAKPSSLGIWAVADGEEVRVNGNSLRFPADSLIRVDELYTVRRRGDHIDHNVGLRLPNDELGQRIAKTCEPWGVRDIAADPQVDDATRADQSIADQMRAGAEAAGYPVSFHKADNRRVPGWQAVRQMMKESAKEYPEGPGLYVVSTCRDFLRTIPGCQIDPARGGEDVKKQGEDHCADETRYGVMSRPTGPLIL